MITAEISCDVASLAIEAGDTIFTLPNDIGSDGGFHIYIYLDYDQVNDTDRDEMMDARAGALHESSKSFHVKKSGCLTYLRSK